MTELLGVDLLILDDFALDAMSKEESKDVYQLFLERTGRASMIISSNRDTAEWLAMFDDMLLAQSAVDRFKNAAFDFIIDGESYRPHLKPKLDGTETVEVDGVAGGIKPGMDVACTITRKDGTKTKLSLRCRIDTLDEVEYFKNGGILQFVLRDLAKAA